MNKIELSFDIFKASQKLISCNEIAEDKIKGTLHFDGKEFVITGAIGYGGRPNNGLDWAGLFAVECVDLENYTGVLTPLYYNAYHNEVYKGARERGYNAILVNHDGRKIVLTGNQVEFIPKAINRQPPKALTGYLGGKNGGGTPQILINHVPPHNTFVTLFAGHCGLHRNIKPARTAIINDLDPKVYTIWRDYYLGNADVAVFNADTLAILKAKAVGGMQLDMPSTFIYLDPPYKHDTRKAPATSKYNFELSDAQHLELLEAVNEFKLARIMISHYPCDIYNEALAGWSTHDYQSMTRAGLATERIYYNYPKPTVLHDYRYIGADFREREAHKRQKTNLMRKLEEMPPLLRNSILQDLTSHYNSMLEQ